jgi:hypothetical protein
MQAFVDYREAAADGHPAMRGLRVLVAAALALPAVPGAEPLGRLFYTPGQRAQLDTARSQRSRAPAVAAEQEPAAAVPELLTYDGMVRRSDGKTTVWINNRPIHDGRPATIVPFTSKLRPDGSVKLGVTQTDQSVDLRVGQSAELMSGTITESYSRAPSSSAAAAKRPVRPDAVPMPAETRRSPAPGKDADEGPESR